MVRDETILGLLDLSQVQRVKPACSKLSLREGVMDREKIKSIAWGAVGGALVTMYVGFNVGGWMTNGGALAMAKETAAIAVAERLGTICVAQFNRDTAKGQKLIDMKGKDTWERGRYIDTQSWAIMPGDDKAENGVSDACAKQLATKS
jgi:hypothetical protein